MTTVPFPTTIPSPFLSFPNNSFRHTEDNEPLFVFAESLCSNAPIRNRRAFYETRGGRFPAHLHKHSGLFAELFKDSISCRAWDETFRLSADEETDGEHLYLLGPSYGRPGLPD